jgi:phosphatidylglycerophosphatase A
MHENFVADEFIQNIICIVNYVSKLNFNYITNGFCFLRLSDDCQI